MITLLTTAGVLGVLAPADELSQLHPAEAVLYLEVPDVPGLLEAYQQTAYALLLSDGDFQAALGGVLGEEDLDPWEALMDVIALAEEEGDLPVRELLNPLTRVAVSVSVRDADVLAFVARMEQLELEGAADLEYEAAVAEDIGLQLTLDFESAEAATAVVEFLVTTLRAEGLEPESSRVAGLPGGEAQVLQFPEGLSPLTDTVRLIRSGPRLIGLIGNLDLVEVLVRASQTAAGATRFATGRKLFDAPAGVTYFELENRVSDQLMTLAPSPAISPLLDLAEGLLGPNLTMLTRGGHWRVQLRDGRFVTEGLHPAPKHSPFDGLFASQPLSEGALSLIHPDAIVAWAVHFDKNKALALLEQMTAGATDDPFAEIEQAYGFRPDRDLIEPLGPALTYSLPAEISLLSAPPLMVSIALSDADAFKRGIKGVLRMIEDEALEDMSFSSRPYRGHDIYTLTFETDLGSAGAPSAGKAWFYFEDLPFDILAVIRPSLVVLEDRVLITTNPTHVKKEIRRILKGDAVMHPLLEAGAIPEGATEVGFADWIQVVGKLYTGAKSVAPLLEGFVVVGDAGVVDLTQLPEADVFTGYFQTSKRWKRQTQHGVLHRAESSFGPEVPLGLAAWIGISTMTESEPSWEEPQAPAPVVEDDR